MDQPLYMKKKRVTASASGIFWRGFFTGFFIVIVIMGCAGFILYKNPAIVLNAIEAGTDRVISDSMNSLPKHYLIDNKEEIAARVEQLTEAYANDQLTEEDIRSLGMEAMSFFADRRITTDEIDMLMRKVDELTIRDRTIIKNILDL